MAGCLYLLVALLITISSCGFLPPMNATTALVVNQTEYVSACGLKVLTFTASSPGAFYFDLVFTPKVGDFNNVNFQVTMALYGPSTGDKELNAFDAGCAASCNSTSLAGCTLTEVCGNQNKPWFVYVRSTNLQEGQFSLNLIIRPQPATPVLTINNDYKGDAQINVLGNRIDTSVNPLSAYDLYTFSIPANVPPGSSLEILIYTNDLVSVGKFNTFLNYGGVAFPQRQDCLTAVNRTYLTPCEVAQGGTWGITVQRTLNFQNYSLFAYLLPGVSTTLDENRLSEKQSLRTVQAAAYFTYSVPGFTADNNQTQAQVIFAVENIVGGAVKIEVFSNAPGFSGLTCVEPAKTCTSTEGCHITIPFCQIQSGTYLVVVTATTVNNAAYPVYFTVLGRLRQVPTIMQNAGDKFSGILSLSEYDHYRISNPGGENWVDIELYVDYDKNDLPAEMYVGFNPFPNNDQENKNEYGLPVEGILPFRPTRRNEYPSCNRNYNQSYWKRCKADRTNSNGLLRLCFIQLDPCELQRFNDGIFLSVFNNNQSVAQHTWTQNPFSYTVYTKVWSPHSLENTLSHGVVRTDYVQNDLRKAYVLQRGSGNLKITLSANFQEVANGSPNANLNEISYEFVYSQRNCGPWCNTCYRVQNGPVNVAGSKTVTFELPRCIESNRGTDILNNRDYDEYVYLVIKGISNNQGLNSTENRFVLTVKNSPLQQVYDLQEGQLSNQVSYETAFGQTEYWIFRFNQYQLYDHILSVRFRAHPRSGRRMTLKLRDPRGFNPFCADDNWNDVTGPNCKKNFEVKSYTLVPSEANKGYALLNFQICNLTSLSSYGFGGNYGGQEVFDIVTRIFLAEVGFVSDAPQYGAGFLYNAINKSYVDDGTTVDTGYSLKFHLVPQVPTQVYLDQTTLVEIPEQQYVHFYLNVDATKYSTGNHYLIIEAYFDSNAIYLDNSRTMTMYINDPTVGKLAGDPYQSYGCLCHKNKFQSVISGTKKFVYTIPPCSVIGGTYRFSFYTEAHALSESPSLVNIRATVKEYVQPLAFEKLIDFSLYPSQSTAFKIDIDSDLITSNTYVDKEVRFRLVTNQPRYGLVPSFSVSNTSGDCSCGDTGSVAYKCASTTEAGSYDCKLNLGFCQLDPGTRPLPATIPWYIIVNYPTNQTTPEANQIVPMSIFVTKFNFFRDIKPLTTTAACTPYSARQPGVVSTYLESNQHQYFSVSFNGNGVFSAYIENITSGSLQVYFGNSYLPSPNPGCSDAITVCNEGSQGCKLTTTCPVSVIGVKATSNLRNRPVSFKITTCATQNALFSLNGPATNVNVQPSGGFTDTALSLETLTNANFPMVVIFASIPSPLPAGQYQLSYSLGSCGGCSGSFTRSVNCSSLNCTLAFNVCELPLNYKSLVSNVRIINSLAGTGARGFSVQATSVPIPAPAVLSSNVKLNQTANQNGWLSVSWTLGNEVLVAEAGIQTSTLSFAQVSQLGGGNARFYRTFSNGDCPALFTGTSIPLSSCCSQPGTYSFAFFQLDVQAVTFEFNPQLITQSTHSYFNWPSAAVAATTNVNMVATPTGKPTVLTEVFTVMPLGIAKYSTLIVQPSASTTLTTGQVRVYVSRKKQAGLAHGGCFDCEAGDCTGTGTLTGGPDGFNATLPFFLCDTTPSGVWIGFENTLDTAQTGAVSVSVAQPIKITLGQEFTFVGGVKGVNQQFFFEPKENSWSQRLYRVNLTFSSGVTISNVYVNVGGPAGPAGGCLANVNTFPNVQSPFSGAFASCNPSAPGLPYYYIGVVTGSFTSSYSIVVEEQDQLIQQGLSNSQLDVAGGASLTNQVNGNFFFNVAGATNTSIVVLTVDGFTGNQNGVLINVFRDGKCLNLTAETFCSPTTTFGYKCTNYIPACELKNGFQYHVVVTGVTGTFSINAKLTNIPVVPITYNYTTNSLTDNTQFFSSAVEPHAFQQFKFTIPSNFRDYHGGSLTINLEQQFCGAVDAFGTQGSMAGPGCDAKPRCSATGCTIISYAQCDELSNKNIRHNLDFHILVRGKVPVEFKTISYRFTILRTNNHLMFPFRYLEKHLMYPLSVFENQLPTCPVQATSGLKPCCVGTPGASWYMPKTVYSFSVEGDEYLGFSNFHRLHLRLVDDRINNAKLTVYNGYPSFCSSGPMYTENAAQIQTCVADNVNRNCTINLVNSAACGVSDAHQFFFTVEPVGNAFNSNAGALPTDPSEMWPVYSLSHTHQPYEIIEVQFSEGPQYFRSTLALNEISYFKVYQTAQNRPDYHFVVQIQQIIGGTVALTNSWNTCANPICSDSDCRNYDANRPCSEFLPDCTCKIELLHCATGEITKHTPESFFQLKATSVKSTTLVQAQIKVTFVERLVFQPDRVCDTIGCSDVRYYNTWSSTPNNEQLYRYRIRGVEGSTTLSVQNDFASLPGFPASSHAPCKSYRKCTVVGPELPGNNKQCEFYYRQPGVVKPYASVSVANPGLGECARSLDNFEDLDKNRYNLQLDLITPPITTLADGNLTDSTYYQGPNNCKSRNESYYYKFDATKGTYMVVELWSIKEGAEPTEKLQLWVTKDHIAYNLFGEAINLGCQTNTNLPSGNLYCRYLLICNYTTGTYYIQVTDTRSIDNPHVDHVYFHHKIRVSTMTHNNVALSFLNATRFVLPYDNRQITTFTIPVDGKTVNSEQDFEAFVNGQANSMDTWLTRSLFGGPECAVAVGGSTNFSRLAVPNCFITDIGDRFIVHVIRSVGADLDGSGVCTDSQVTVHSRFTQEIDTVNGTYQPNVLGGAPTTISIRRLAQDFGAFGHLVKYNLPALGERDVVYARVSSFDPFVNLKVTLYKGNHIQPQPQNTYAIACTQACAQAPQLSVSNVVWADKCWHCGTGVHGPVFARIDGTAQSGNIDLLTFNLAVVVTQWVDLSSSFNTITLPNEEPTLSFFTMVHTRSEGTRVEIDVVTGAPIEVNVYSEACDIRTAPTQYWCFKGVRCEISLPRKANFGSYYRRTTQDSSYLGNGAETLKIVVRGFDSVYRIRQVRGSDSCVRATPSNAPFCGSIPSAGEFNFWGIDSPADSFLAKDRNAQEFYANLSQAFTCGVTDSCDCPPQTDACVRALQAYACQSMFNPCDGSGFEKGPSYRVCRNVEHECGRTFLCAGIPRLSCNHTFYSSGIEKVDLANFPLNSLDDPDFTNDSSRRGGIIALIVLLAVLAVVVLGIVGYILYQRSSALSSVVFDESKLGEYEAM